jgi:peptidyl-tRNA hydrolase, PTH1 family
MYIIVGLGNPGREYVGTRHNMGFMALDVIADRHNIEIKKENFRSVYGEGRIGGERVILAKPLTFMNNSGWAVRDLVNWFKVEHNQLIVIYDDIDIEPGELRIREKGSSGSHNGMKSIIYQLGFDDFPRIRVGTGAPEGGRDLIAHVMSCPEGESAEKIKVALSEAADAAELIASGRIADAQMRFNKKPKRKKKEEAKLAEQSGKEDEAKDEKGSVRDE